MDQLILSGMHFHAFHGVDKQENKVGNHFTVDLIITADFSKPCQTDEIQDALNYAQVYELVAQVMAEPCHLLERVAENIAQTLKQHFPVIQQIEINLSKHNPPIRGQLDKASIRLIR
jgi:dihydroneopterin aldolase